MTDIIAQIREILQEEKGILEREAKVCQVFKACFCQVMAQALESLDLPAIQPSLSLGYRIEKRSKRQLTFPFGTVTFYRRRLIKKGEAALYPLDTLLNLAPRQQFSCGAESLLAEASTQGVYRKTAEMLRIVSPLSVSHQKLREIAVKVGQGIDRAQSADLSQESAKDQMRKVKVLYVEGDAFCVRAQGGGLLYLHRLQVCEGRRAVSSKRNALIGFHEFIDTDCQKVYAQMQEYLCRTYDLRQVTLVTNSDNGWGYLASNFRELISERDLRHEHFIDRYHVHKKLKERLNFVPESLQKQFREVLCQYDKEALVSLYDTVESFCDSAEQLEELRLLKDYLHKNWLYLRPFEQRRALQGAQRVLGTCESNHRVYTFRMKKQGKYWSETGALAMAKLISARRNGEFWKYGAGAQHETAVVPAVPGQVVRGLRALWGEETDYEDLRQAHIPDLRLRAAFAHF